MIACDARAANCARWPLEVATIVVVILASSVMAQVPDAAEPAPELKLPSTWLGSAPPSMEALRGKAVLLYYFEETCPRCREKWPSVMEVAARHQDDPIAFVAVNSGSPAAAVAAYARSVHLNWPIIVDADRSFERQSGVGEISLQNIIQVCYITADGELRRGRWSDLEGTIRDALEGASWKVDPAEVPDELRAAWRNVEFANYAAAAPIILKAANSRKAEVKAAAQRLVEVVDQQATEDLAAAKAEEEQSKYRAYQRYATIAQQYAGFPAATEAQTARRALAADRELRAEQVAVRVVEKQQPLLHSERTAVRERAAAAIRKIIDEQPDSEAARIGRELLRSE